MNFQMKNLTFGTLLAGQITIRTVGVGWTETRSQIVDPGGGGLYDAVWLGVQGRVCKLGGGGTEIKGFYKWGV